MVVPGKGHKDVGKQQQDDGTHGMGFKKVDG
jgi:hypothetical protein